MLRNRSFQLLVVLAVVAAVTLAVAIATASAPGSASVGAESAMFAYRQGEQSAGLAPDMYARQMQQAIAEWRLHEKPSWSPPMGEQSAGLASDEYRLHSLIQQAIIEWRQGQQSAGLAPDISARPMERPIIESTADIRVHASRDPATPVVEGARASLVTNDNGISYTFQTRDLVPGHIYTLWVVVINAPENCATTPCTPADVLGNTDAVQANITYGAGRVVGDSGQATLAGAVSAGVLEAGWYGNAFTNPRGAEIHLVLHSHGPAIADLLSNMLHSYRGGCTDASLPPAFPGTAKADGIPGPNTCQSYQFAIFPAPAD